MKSKDARSAERHPIRNIVTGILVLTPLWVTWVVFGFILTELSRIGKPWGAAIRDMIVNIFPGAAPVLNANWLESLLGVVVTLGILYFVGWIAGRVVGMRLVAAFESLVERVPLVKVIYGGTRNLLSALQTKPAGLERVVLIEFPSPEMKAVGLVTRTMIDETTGEELAAVYVPTSPNPTSGYMEIVPVRKLIATDWTLDEAMRFVITGGTSAPESVRYTDTPKT